MGSSLTTFSSYYLHNVIVSNWGSDNLLEVISTLVKFKNRNMELRRGMGIMDIQFDFGR